MMFRSRNSGSPHFSRKRNLARTRRRLRLELLEPRVLLTTPGNVLSETLYTDVAFTDARGDTVEVSINGPTSANVGFTMTLAGGALDNADINNINLLGVSSANNLTIQVTPTALTITGGSPNYGQMFSAGYVNVTSITAVADSNFLSAAAVTNVGGIHLSAAIAKTIALPDVGVGDITLDAGDVPYVDTVDAATLNNITVSAPTITATGGSSLQEVYDESPTGQYYTYTPCTGLIGLDDIEAQSVTSIVINGASVLTTGNNLDQLDRGNDFDGTIVVTGAIGSIDGANSTLKGTIIAGSIGSTDLGAISGTISTTNSADPLTITLPSEFVGFLNSAGHLNVSFSQETSTTTTTTGTTATASAVTGSITAGGGISGIVPTSQTDPIYIPSEYIGAVTNTSTTSGIADIEINGIGKSQWSSASSIGDITANSFDPTFIAMAGTSIGNITSTTSDIAGHFQAGGSIGNVSSAANIPANLIAGGNIGAITGITGGMTSNIVQAGGNIGNISVIQLTVATTQITATGTIGSIYMYSGQWDARVLAANIGDITDASGNFLNAVFVATDSIGDISVTAKTGDAITGGSIIAGTNIGNVAGYSYEGRGIYGTLIQAGDQEGDTIAGVTGISYGATTLPAVTPGITTQPTSDFNGIDSAQILAAGIGPILGHGYVGIGINQAVIHSQIDSIASISGIGNSDGIYGTTVVSEAAIGPISGQSTVQGNGIEGGSFDANGTASALAGTIGQITGQGGPAGGDGIFGTRFQASGAVTGISGTANANGGDAIYTITALANSYGDIDATVLGGQTGNGITNSNIKAWSNYNNVRGDVQLAAINVEVRSALGIGIKGSIFTVKGDLTAISVTALGASAISASTFTISQGDFGSIYADSINSGTAIDASTFTSNNGSITSATDLGDALATGITAVANGTQATSHAISGSTFTADENIGFINASANGGSAILDSTFTADSDYGNANNGPNLSNITLPGDGDLGTIYGINASTSGQNLASSAGISGSSFEGESIGPITVSVTDREEGGPGIINSSFTARNAVYDGAGTFNNEGTIGAISVTDGSLSGNGIDTSEFIAGAAGSIGNISVQTLGGIGIYASTFSASTFDYDQANFNSQIGNITVTTGRSGGNVLTLPAPPNDAWTVLPAGISTSYFAANAGIGDINVNSIGTGVFYSAFLGNFASNLGYGAPGLIFPSLAPNVPGDIGNINITATGRFGAGSILSLYSGDNVGDINIQVASRNPNGSPISLPAVPGLIGIAVQFVENLINYTIANVGPAASAGSAFVATNGNIGQISINNTGPGFDSVASAFVALPAGSYGPVTNLGNFVSGNVFWGYPRLFSSTNASSAAITSVKTPTASVYGEGDLLVFKVNFSRTVDVSGQPTLAVQLGSETREALYQSGSGTSQLVFSLVIDPSDSGNVTISSGTSIQTDVDNRISDSATGIGISQLSVGTVDTTGIVVNTSAPFVVRVSAIKTSVMATGKKAYQIGELLTVLVTFSESVLVTGLPTMALKIGKLSRSLVYSSGSGTDTLTFTYKITKADVKQHEAATTGGQIILPSKAKITDLAGNSADLHSTPTTVVTNAVSTSHVVASVKKTRDFTSPHRALGLAKRAIVAKQGLAAASARS
jgi:hypothetical protein